jgi:hypothetical protein
VTAANSDIVTFRTARSLLFLDEGQQAAPDALVGNEPFDLTRGGELL